MERCFLHVSGVVLGHRGKEALSTQARISTVEGVGAPGVFCLEGSGEGGKDGGRPVLISLGK